MCIKTVGFPVIHKEEKEIRAFLPSLINRLEQYDVDVYVEKGYGGKMGFNDDQYLEANKRVRLVSHEGAYSQDLVIVLRAPSETELAVMNRNSGLLSMLHYDSKPGLKDMLKQYGINSFSLDSIVDDEGRRMVVTYEQTAWAGVSTALDEMSRRRSDFYSPDRAPLQVVIIGMGLLGINAAKSCFAYSSRAFSVKAGGAGQIPGVNVTFLEKDTTHLNDHLAELFKRTDLLIDATKREDFSRYIIPNHLLQNLKPEAVILDLTADNYDSSKEPVQVKAIEGLPYGTLDKCVLDVDAPEYEQIPPRVRTDFRRLTVSCNGWPGLFPEKSMQIYEAELLPFIDVLLTKGFRLCPHSDNLFERALYRSTIDYFETL